MGLALFCLGTAGFATQKTLVSADEESGTNQLLLPISYEEYLPLSAPSGVAICENYTAIADGNTLFVYDRQREEYRTYTHNEHGENDSRNAVKQVQFDENETLYFTDDSTSDNLYALNMKTVKDLSLTITHTR